MSIQKTIKIDSRRPNLNARFFEQGLPKSAVLINFKDFDRLIKKSINGSGLCPKLAKEVAYQEPPAHFQDPAHSLFHEKVWESLEELRLKLRETLLKSRVVDNSSTPKDIRSLTALWKETGKSEGTLATRQTAINHLLGYLPRKALIGDIDVKLWDIGYVSYLNAYRSKRTGEKLSAGSKHQVHKQVHQFWQWCRKKSLIEFVEKELTLPEPAPRSIALEKDQVKQVLAAIEDDSFFSHAAFSTGAVRNIRRSVRFLRYTGVRRAELYNLRLEDIFPEGTSLRPFPHCLVLPKGSQERANPKDANINHKFIRSIANKTLLKFLKKDLENRSKYEIWFLDNGYGSPQWGNPSGIYRNLKTILKKLGIEGVQPCHVWRHTAGAEFTEASQPITLVQHILGHSTAATTAKYYQNADRIQRQFEAAASVLD